VYFLTGFEQRPQHLLGTVGILSFLLGLLGLMYLAVYWVIKEAFGLPWEPLHQRPAMFYSMGALLLGAQFMSIGFLAELMTAYYGRVNVVYSIKDRIGGDGDDRRRRDAPEGGGDAPPAAERTGDEVDTAAEPRDSAASNGGPKNGDSARGSEAQASSHVS
jgi:hypothetical protein